MWLNFNSLFYVRRSLKASQRWTEGHSSVHRWTSENVRKKKNGSINVMNDL